MRKNHVVIGTLTALIAVLFFVRDDFNHVFRSGVEIEGAAGYRFKDSSRRAIFRDGLNIAIVPPQVYQYKVVNGVLVVARMGENEQLVYPSRECQKLGIDIRSGRAVDLPESVSSQVNCQ